jgi:putative endonuclease
MEQLVARWAHNPKVVGSSPTPATREKGQTLVWPFLFYRKLMFFVYILYSSQFDKTYVGFTSDLQGRLSAHNHPQNKGYTKRFQPWEMLISEECESKSEVMEREQWYKSGVGREKIKQILIEKGYRR